MQELNHPNVLTLMGVCLDGGPAPFIVMPFMANGSLHSYLRKNRSTLLLTGSEEVATSVYMKEYCIMSSNCCMYD